MAEAILDGTGSGYPWKITNKNEGVITGSVVFSNPQSIIGSVAITNAHIDVDVTVEDYVSVTQSGAYLVTLGSTNINNVITGSVVQSTNPWIVLGSTAITNVVPISGTITVNSEMVGYDSNEQLTFLSGSPTYNINVFTGGVVQSLIVKCNNDTYVGFDSIPTVNNFLVNAGQSVSADFKAGSVYTLAKSSTGSVWVWGGR